MYKEGVFSFRSKVKSILSVGTSPYRECFRTEVEDKTNLKTTRDRLEIVRENKRGPEES